MSFPNTRHVEPDKSRRLSGSPEGAYKRSLLALQGAESVSKRLNSLGRRLGRGYLHVMRNQDTKGHWIQCLSARRRRKERPESRLGLQSVQAPAVLQGIKVEARGRGEERRGKEGGIRVLCHCTYPRLSLSLSVFHACAW